MDVNEYQKLTAETEIYSDAADVFLELIGEQTKNGDFAHNVEKHWLQLAYCVGKLNGESGEAAEIVFKAFRGDAGRLTTDQIVKLAYELGDIQWYLARMADLLGYTLEQIMEMNIEKLKDRQTRNVLHGYGDER